MLVRIIQLIAPVSWIRYSAVLKGKLSIIRKITKLQFSFFLTDYFRTKTL